MAAPLDRTWYNTLVNDDGSGTTGTVWNKEQVDALMDVVDASLGPIVDRGGAPAANQVARFSDGDTITGTPSATLEPTQAALTLTGTYPNVALVDPGATAGDQLVRLVNTTNAFYIIAAQLLLSLSRGGLLTAHGGVAVPTGGVTFPVTPVPSAGVTTFDEYREAPWTPTVTGGNGGSGTTYSLREGSSVKMGRLVVAQGRVSFVTVGTLVGPGLYIQGLPYVCGAMPGVVTFSAAEGLGLSVSSLAGSVLASQSQFQLKDVPAVGSTALENFPHTGFTNATFVEFTAIYQAAS